MPVITVRDDWWPEFLRDFASEDPLGRSDVVVADVLSTDDGNRNYRQVFTALVAPEHLTPVLEHPGGIGHEVASSGPHPAPLWGKWDYLPRFWISASGTPAERLEPLVVAWRSANQTVLLPDQGFLMTYGLVPRIVNAADVRETRWDDPSFPQRDIVVARPVSTYFFPTYSGACVTVEREYLQDYSTIRGRALVQVYYIQRAASLTEEISSLLGDEEGVELRLPGRLIDLRIVNWGGKALALAQVWGVRPLLEPGDAPVSAGRDDFGTLSWPGIAKAVTEESAKAISLLEPVYVKDDVLDAYEGWPEYSIHPESGSVSYGSQWGVSYTRRVGRDLIEVEIKKLYEGNHADTVRLWHQYAVQAPANISRLRREANVGTRARRIVYGVADLGRALAELYQQVLGQHASSADLVGLDTGDLEYSGWWTIQGVEPITHHIPLKLREDAFVSRCSNLNTFVTERLSQKHLRRLIETIGIPPSFTEDFGGLKLLEHLLELLQVSGSAGLDLKTSGALLHERTSHERPPVVLARLFALNELRQLGSHRADASRERRLREALKRFGMDTVAYRGGWGRALDAVYDGVGETIEGAAGVIDRAIHSI